MGGVGETRLCLPGSLRKKHYMLGGALSSCECMRVCMCVCACTCACARMHMHLGIFLYHHSTLSLMWQPEQRSQDATTCLTPQWCLPYHATCSFSVQAVELCIEARSFICQKQNTRQGKSGEVRRRPRHTSCTI